MSGTNSFQLSLKKALEIVLCVEILILYILFRNLKLQFDQKRKCDVNNKNTVKNVMKKEQLLFGRIIGTDCFQGLKIRNDFLLVL